MHPLPPSPDYATAAQFRESVIIGIGSMAKAVARGGQDDVEW